MVIDPAGDVDKIVEMLEILQAKLKYIYLTHCHGDHIGGVQELKERYLIGLVTDNKCDRINTILEYRGLGEYFDVIAISANLHSGKDSDSIFKYVLDVLDISASECLSIDNTEKNLVVPREMGMATILYDDDNRDYDLFVNVLEKIIG